MPKNTKLIITVIAVALLIIPIVTKASDIKSGQNVYLSPQETIDGNLYAASNNITIDGEIKGDLIAAAQTITINGRLDGDLIAAAQTITINGEINGSVRLMANNASINGTIARNVNFIGNSLLIEKSAKIGWDVMSGAINTSIAGIVNGNIYVNGKSLILSGSLGKNLDFQGDKESIITLSPEASINGNLSYPDSAKLLIKDGSKVSGQIIQTKKSQNKKSNNYLSTLIYKILAAIIIGLILIGPGKKIVLRLGNIIKTQSLSSIAWGLLAFLVTPTLSLILIFTIIGAPLAILTILLWIIALYLGKVLSALILGKEISKLFYKNKEERLLIPLIIGVIISWLLFSIPIIGWMISLIATCLGLGSLTIYLKTKK